MKQRRKKKKKDEEDEDEDEEDSQGTDLTKIDTSGAEYSDYLSLVCFRRQKHYTSHYSHNATQQHLLSHLQCAI